MTDTELVSVMVVSTKNGVKNGLRKNLKALSQRDSPSANNTFFVFRTKFSRWFVQLDFDSHFSKNPHLQTEKYTVKNWVWKNPRALSQRESPSANNIFFFSPRNASLVQNSVDTGTRIGCWLKFRIVSHAYNVGYSQIIQLRCVSRSSPCPGSLLAIGWCLQGELLTVFGIRDNQLFLLASCLNAGPLTLCGL